MTDLAREYGEGLFALAKEENLLDRIHEELNALGGILSGRDEYTRLMLSRAVSKTERLGMLDEAFRGRVHPYVLNFMKILLERGAFDALHDCATHYHTRWCEENGIVEAFVTTARPLSQAQREGVAARLSAMSSKKVTLIERVDPDVMGGLRVDMQGKRYDNTIQHRLALMRRHLTEE